MNTKRQTIWLVSMLSLMVVLSAYYLFTEDVSKLNTASDKVTQEGIKVTTDVKDPQAGDQAVSGGLASSTSTSTGNASKTGDTSKTGDAKAAQGQTTDSKVLEKMASAKSGAEYFAELAFKRNQEFTKQIEQLLNTTADTKKSADEISKAHDEYERVQTMQAKVENLEDLLMKSYKNAIVLEEGKKYKAVVQADKLDAKQAQSIIDMMIKELNVTKDTVSVQYMH
ncbi:SpoIIIAH-like family protein [Gorillibacterium sp. sgz5001074]|uniref:SpoIIIAH-like family protein n=1 Tax=Gorillibacterium sp. sgz5001074 TaxID=3446695 RepID=UPI003F666206